MTAWPRLSSEEWDAETDRLRALGLRVSDAGALRADPFDEPRDGRSFVVPMAWHARAAGSPGPLRADALAQDLPVLEAALRAAYAGWESAEARGWSWESFFEDWRRRLAARDVVSPADAFAPWRDLVRFQIDNHSGPRGLSAFQALARTSVLDESERPEAPLDAWRNDAGEEGPIDPADPGQQPQASTWLEGGVLRSIHVVRGPASRGRLSAVRAAGRWRPVRPGDAVATDADTLPHGHRVSSRRLSSRLGCVRVPTLTYDAVAPDLLDRAAEIEGAEALVWDLRGNAGGTLSLLVPLLERLAGIGMQVFDVPIRTKESAVSAALQWGCAQTQLATQTSPLPVSTRALLQRQLDVVTTSEASGHATWRRHEGSWSLRERRSFTAPAAGRPWHLVLVDAGCGSDGELLAAALAARPGSVVAGGGTAGVGGFARPGHLVLPFTRAGFRMATARADLYGDGRSFDGFGLTPDVVPAPSVVWDVPTLEALLLAVQSRAH